MYKVPIHLRPIRSVKWSLATVTAALAFAAMLAFAAPSSGAASAAHAAARRSLDPRIATVLAAHPDTPVTVIVQFGASVPAARAQHDVAAVGGRAPVRLQIIPAIAARMTAAAAARLSGEPDVTSVSLNAPVRSSGVEPSAADASADGNVLGNTFADSLDAPALWRAGGTGAGVGVAVIDTGVDGNLSDFAGPHGSRVIADAATNPGAQTADDTYGHGTFVAGIIAGDSAGRAPSDPLRNQFAGVAPAANLVSIKVADEQGYATVLDVIYGLQFAVDFQHRYDIRVINLSLDADAAQSYRQDPLDAAVEAAWMHGITVVAAAGNRGDAPDAVQYAPANDPYVITVGGVDEHGTGTVADDTVAAWSSRGTTQDGFAKPEVDAPGAHIVSELAPDSAFSTACPSCIVDGQYIKASGTSFAAPMISGLIADLLELHPAWTPDQVKGALTDPSVQATAIPEADGLEAARLTNPPAADQGLTPSGLIAGNSGTIDYSRSSWSRSSWSRSSWSRSSWSRSSWSRSSWSGDTGLARSSWSAMSWSALPF